MKKVSIIIPTYNAAKRIKKCLSSLQKQTYNNIEIICVNDGSSDNTLSVLENIQSRDNRITIINQKNSGAFQARKTGILAATGDYIMFVDADDEIVSANCLDILINTLLKYKDTQIVQFGYKNVKNCCSVVRSPQETGLLNATEFKQKHYKDFIGNGLFIYFSVNLWSKIYRADIVKDAVKDLDTRIKMGEDLYLNLSILDHPDFNNILAIPDVIYKYNLGIGASSRIPDNILDEYSELKSYQSLLCDKWSLCEDAKNYCNLESIYYQLNLVRQMYFSGYDEQRILDYLNTSRNYGCIKQATEYFNSRPDEELFDELITLVNATPTEYLQYVKEHSTKPKNIFQKGLDIIFKSRC